MIIQGVGRAVIFSECLLSRGSTSVGQFGEFLEGDDVDQPPPSLSHVEFNSNHLRIKCRLIIHTPITAKAAS